MELVTHSTEEELLSLCSIWTHSTETRQTFGGTVAEEKLLVLNIS